MSIRELSPNVSGLYDTQDDAWKIKQATRGTHITNSSLITVYEPESLSFPCQQTDDSHFASRMIWTRSLLPESCKSCLNKKLKFAVKQKGGPVADVFYPSDISWNRFNKILNIINNSFFKQGCYKERMGPAYPHVLITKVNTWTASTWIESKPSTPLFHTEQKL
jgi:hypothetical protein